LTQSGHEPAQGCCCANCPLNLIFVDRKSLL
jgi:hypothetical protein